MKFSLKLLIKFNLALIGVFAITNCTKSPVPSVADIFGLNCGFDTNLNGYWQCTPSQSSNCQAGSDIYQFADGSFIQCFTASGNNYASICAESGKLFSPSDKSTMSLDGLPYTLNSDTLTIGAPKTTGGFTSFYGINNLTMHKISALPQNYACRH